MDVLKPLITALHNEGRLRVWSLVITIFGDAVQHRGGRIATLRLQYLLERVGVEAGALRTALSRLTRDGWLLRDREGRNSFYRLSESGQAEVATAAVDIYRGASAGKTQTWTMAHGAKIPIGGIEISASVWLVPADMAGNLPEHICVSGVLSAVPEQYKKQILTPEHADALLALNNDVEALRGLDLTPLDAMAARMLLIHRWRRIVLRFPEILPELLPQDFMFSTPRQSVSQAYNQLTVASECWLENADHGMAAMPQCAAEFKHRF